MRISLLLEREPFGQILEETLPELLVALTGRRHRVRWLESRGASRPDEQTWLCNPRLNVIFRPGTPSTTLAPVVREFARSPRWWHRPFQRAWVAAATRPPTAAWLAPIRIGVSPPLESAGALVILGGNHRLRVLDARAGVTHVVAKAGTDPRFLRAELALRSGAADLPIPRLVRIGSGGGCGWFTETLVSGTPLNRIAGRSRRTAALGVAHGALERLARRTAAAVPARDYVGSLLGGLQRDVATAPLFAPRRPAIERTARALAALATRLPGAPSITTAETHGDFQDGNVLVDGDTVWMIDWEYTGRRQIGFDVLVHALAARFPSGLAGRVRAMAEGRAAGPLEPLDAWAGLDWSTTDARRRALAIFLLEELAVRVRENTGPRLTALTAATRTFLDELEAAAGRLETMAA
jgi:hypothetical protein